MAHYFNYFPKMYYDAAGNNNPQLVTNILKRVKIRDGLKNDVTLFDKYQVHAGETPELVSQRLYESVDYYWVILLINNIKDRYYEWPLSEQAFEEFVKGKYTNPFATRHFEITQTSGPTSSGVENSHLIEVNSTTPGAAAVSFYEHERRRQDKLMLIKVLRRDFLSPFVEEFSRLVR